MSAVGQVQSPAVGSARQPLIARDDLVACLDRMTARKVTIISAPAGSGKTSLLRAWAQRPDRDRRLAVVQVRRDEHDAQPFWIDLFNAVRQGSGTTQREPVAATPDFDGRAAVDRMLAELAGHRGRVVLVIDDAHELASAEALAQLRRLLANLPPQAHAVVSTRRDLWLGLHQLRLADELAEVRAADLRFTEQETRELLEACGVTLSQAGTALLHRRTEGWAAGLRLAALSLAGHPDPERFVAEFSGTDRTVADYLLAEMLERQPGQVQDLLLRTSLLDRVNGELADLLTGRPGSEGILLELEDANAFVVSLDPQRTWFRFHQMFGDMLRLVLRRRLPEQLPTLHRRAAAWFAQHDHVVEAIRHTQAAGDWHDAARLLADHSFGLTFDGQARTLQVLLRAFPPGAVADPELAVVRATSDLFRGRLDEAAAHLAVAESYAETMPSDRRRRLEVAITSLRLGLARRRGHLAGVVEQAGFLDTPVTGQSDEDIALGADLRAVALMNLGTAEAWSRALPDAERHLREGAALARRIGRPYLEVSCLSELGFAAKARPFAVTQLRCREAIALAERHGWGTEPVIVPALLTLAASLIFTGDFGEGERWLQRAAQALEADAGPSIRLLAHIVGGMLQAGRCRLDEAVREFGAAESLGSRLTGSHAQANQVTGWLICTQVRLGMTGEARAALAAMAAERAVAGEIRNARAAICLADGDPAGALGAVREVLDGTAPVTGHVTVVEAQLLAGLACRALGDRHAANQSAERALALAEADRLVLPFVMTGSLQLLEALPRHQTAHAALLTDILDLLAGSSAAAHVPRSSPPPGELSRGELRVLGYLPTNLSRPEIATELSVSVNTVSTHIRSIYAKLGAEDRSGAVRRARELRLLSAVRTLAAEIGYPARFDLRGCAAGAGISAIRLTSRRPHAHSVPGMKTLTLILTFLPLIVFSVLARFLPHGDIGVAGLAAAAMAVIAIATSHPVWPPKIINTCSLVLFALVAVLGFTLSSHDDRWLATWGGAGMPLIIGLIILILVPVIPFTEQFARQTTPQAYWSSPTFKKINRVLSAGWGAAILAVGISRIAAAAIDGHSTGRLPELLLGLAVPSVILLYMLRFSKSYPERVTHEPAHASASHPAG